MRMAILEDVEVRIVCTKPRRVLDEYDNLSSIENTSSTKIEKYVEAIIGAEFQIETYLKPDFELGDADGIKITADIDGGVVHASRFYDDQDLEKHHSGEQQLVDRTARWLNHGNWTSINYSFGLLPIGKDHNPFAKSTETIFQMKNS